MSHSSPEVVHTGVESSHEQIALVDLLDRLLGAGVVLAGDITISIAGIDLVEVKLHALIMSVRKDMGGGRR